MEPPPAFFTNNQSAFKHQAFVSNEIQRLLETGCICEVECDEAHITVISLDACAFHLRLCDWLDK